jgi:MFS transporter, SET family, sugar efflux transporter
MALPEHVEPTDVALDDPAVHTSALRLTLASPLYRGATIALFLSGWGSRRPHRRSRRSWSTTLVRH